MNTLINSYDFFEQLAELDISYRQLFEILLKKQGLDLFQLPIPKREKTVNIPLSSAQERIWHIAQLTPDLPVDNVPQAFHLQGKLNVKIFEQSLNVLIQQNEVLRTIYTSNGDRIEPMIAPACDIKLEVIDLSQLPKEKRWHQAKQQATEFSRQPFDFARDSLLRSRIYDLGDQDYILLLVSHQLATDGLSFRFLLQELAEHYRAISSAKLISKSQSRIQYSDYAVWRRQLCTEAAFVSQQKYWQQKLSGSPIRLSLPTTSKINSPNFDGSYEEFQLSPSLSEEFRELCKSQGITVFMALVALFQTVLYRCTPEEEICLGTLTSIRNHAQIEKRVGNFSNNLLLKTNFSDDLRICDLFKRVRETTLDAFINQDIPFQSLSNILEVPQFQVLLLVRDSSAAQNLELPGLEIQDFPIDLGFTRMELSLDLTDDGRSSIGGKLEYKKQLFDYIIVRRIAVNLKNLVEQAVNNSEQLISEIILPENIDIKSPDQFIQQTHKSSFVLPQTEIEKQLAKIWSELFQVDSISIDDNFFELGGHSLLAVRLFNQIEQSFGKNLPLSTLLKAPTIKGIANLLHNDCDSVAWSPLVEIKSGGSKTPLFCLHGGGFNVLIYKDLATKLDSNQPVYALQARGLITDTPLKYRIESIASDYIQEIKKIQPQGPYLLAGLSNGGEIALEMAQQITAQGEEVALLAMFDSYGPNSRKLLSSFPRLMSSLYYGFRYITPRVIGKIIKQKPSETILQSFKLLEVFGRQNKPSKKEVPKGLSNNKNDLNYSSSASFFHQFNNCCDRISDLIIERSSWSFFSPFAQLKSVENSLAYKMLQMEKNYAMAHEKYEIKPYSGHIILFRASESPPGYLLDPQLGWSTIAKQGVTVYEIPGHHTSIMQSQLLADKMKVFIDKAIEHSSIQDNE
ncbi:MAG: condensation domain-containing protein [Xenococcus sp. MO_188.B8]|nr:condensation domain-containing protein [Xenococcus sp. MO_188.B8]